MIRRSLLTIGISAIVLCVSAAVSSASIIASWTFEVSLPTGTGQNNGPWAPEIGSGAANGFHAVAATTWSNPVGNGSLESWSSNNWSAGDYYQFEVSLNGFKDATIEWAQTRSSTGPANFDVLVSIDGVNFSSIHSYVVSAITWSSTTFNAGSVFGPISLGSVTNNQSSVFVRLSSKETTAAAGTNRVDDVTIRANVIPEPSAIGLFLIAGFAAIGLRRPRRRA